MFGLWCLGLQPCYDIVAPFYGLQPLLVVAAANVFYSAWLLLLLCLLMICCYGGLLTVMLCWASCHHRSMLYHDG